MPEIASFTAGQAAFTMMVLIVFNLIVPTGWQVGLIRVEDVVVGALVGVDGVGAVVAAAAPPRSASRAIDAGAHHLLASICAAAVLRITRGAFEAITERGRHAEPRRAGGVSGRG